MGRAGHRDREQDQRRDEQNRRKVTPAARLSGRDPLEQLHIGEAQDALSPAQLHRDVDNDHRYWNQREQPVPGMGET